MYATRTKKDHFLGATILMRSSGENSKSYQVIDGQQRLTTVFMYLAILRDLVIPLEGGFVPMKHGGAMIDVRSNINGFLFSDEDGIRYRSNSLLKNFLETYVFTEPAKRPTMPAKHNQYSLSLRKAYARIQSNLTDNLLHVDGGDHEKVIFLWEIVRTFERRLKILKIESDSFSESFDIFMSLNNRGLDLSPSDLVKSLLMKNMSEGLASSALITKNRTIANRWKTITDQIGEPNVDQFLRHYLVSTTNVPIRSSQVFENIEQMINNSESGKKQASDQQLQALQTSSSVYHTLLQPSTIEDFQIRNACTVLNHLTDSYRILMLQVLGLTNILSKKEQQQLSKLCEVLTVRWQLTGGNAQALEDHLQSVCVALRQPDMKFEDVKNQLISINPLDLSVKQYFNLDVSRTTLVRVILHKINSFVGDFSQMIPYSPTKMHVEHIAPVSMTEYWKNALFTTETEDVEAEYSVRVEMWGNKTILDKKINESIGRKPFSTKCTGDESFPGYSNSPIAITKELVKLGKWDYDLIKSRSKWIGDCFLSIWSVDMETSNVISFQQWLSQNVTN
jgi:hypothetical protein